MRYDGGHKRNAFLTDALAAYADYVPLCPEVGAGLGVPRPTVRLVGDIARPRALGTADATLDVTDQLERYTRDTVPGLHQLSGYVLKKDSPSCGMERVKVYDAGGRGAVRKGLGIFARGLRERLPLLPTEEEGRLNDAVIRENFVARCYTLARWQALQVAGLDAKSLIAFHSDHKYLVMAHSQAAYQRLGRMLSNLKGADLKAVGAMYIHELMAALARKVTRKRHVNVLQHITGYFKRDIDAADKQELGDCIDSYRRGEVPLVVPITLLRHYLRRHPDRYMERQHYLRPHPHALGLRNAI